MIIFADRQTDNQTKSNSKTEATFYPLWSVDSRGAGQYISTFYSENKMLTDISNIVSTDYVSTLQ